MEFLFEPKRNLVITEENGFVKKSWEQTLRNGKKEYPEFVTEIIGLQEVEINGKMQLIDRMMTFESKLGTSRCYSIARTEPVSEEERASNRKRIQEIAAQLFTENNAW